MIHMEPASAADPATIPFERFTGQARRAIWLAYQEAQRFEHDYLATEHLLMGLLREGAGDVADVFTRQSIEPGTVIEKLEALLDQADQGPEASVICLTPRARRAMSRAVEEADDAHLDEANSTHLFLALLLDPDTGSRSLLDDVGLNIQRAEAELHAAAAAPNRDRLVQSAAAAGRLDPTADQLAQMLGVPSPHAEMTGERAMIDPALAESDYQLLVTQLVLGLSMGLAAGYILFGGIDGMVGVAMGMVMVAIFRNSLLGTISGAVLGLMIGRHTADARAADTTGATLMLVTLGGFVGSFLGGFWRRFCPGYLRPSMTHQKPPGVV